jgi:hypothetical protein
MLHELVLLKSSTDAFPKHMFFEVSEDTVELSQRKRGNWERASISKSAARGAWSKLLRDGWINAVDYNRDLIDQSKPLAQDNCKHHLGFEGRCEACGYIIY